MVAIGNELLTLEELTKLSMLKKCSGCGTDRSTKDFLAIRIWITPQSSYVKFLNFTYREGMIALLHPRYFEGHLFKSGWVATHDGSKALEIARSRILLSHLYCQICGFTRIIEDPIGARWFDNEEDRKHWVEDMSDILSVPKVLSRE